MHPRCKELMIYNLSKKFEKDGKLQRIDDSHYHQKYAILFHHLHMPYLGYLSDAHWTKIR